MTPEVIALAGLGLLALRRALRRHPTGLHGERLRMSHAQNITQGEIPAGFVAKVEPVANRMRFPNRGDTKIKGIVIHHTHTLTPRATQRVLEAKGLSTNYEVDQQGRILRYGDPDHGFAQATGGGANIHLIAIDVTHYPEDAPFTEIQVEATRQLVHWLAERYGLPLRLARDPDRRKWQKWADEPNRPTLFRHRNFVSTSCPVHFPMDRLLVTGRVA